MFIEYGPAEKAWMPILADNYLAIGCFWVSGKYKKSGHGKKLLNDAITDAKNQKRSGLVTIAGKKKYHFMSDTRWLIRQGFTVCDEAPGGFVLLHLPFSDNTPTPSFLPQVHTGDIESNGCIVYYSNRCPFSEYHVTTSLAESCRKRNIPLKIIKLDTLEQAKSCPSPATIFSLYYQGEFVTTDISVCMDNRFDKYVKR